MFKSLAKLFHRKPQLPPPHVRTTQEGIQVMRGGEKLSLVRWCEVKKIIAYKYALYTTDEVCVAFLTQKDADSWLEINEDWEGFREATDQMVSLFPSIPKDWFCNVSIPAFERKETVLYEESS